MAKVSAIQKNKSRQKKSQRLHNKRSALKSKIYDKSLSLEQRFSLIIALAQLPRNSSSTRIRNRCELTGRPRGVTRKFGISRNKLRELIGRGLVPGVVKASW
ncbi:30S ribosomal protein S14 [Rickettsia typhi]|uniref:Small ribosomal subunit protein uS14 n=2 Tax=Rickettsia typhi TaxID=785 RepID=RS14_RICTY|nr:30S ribosomal protein S14 [Rickettsia typhi]Q68W91.1 RecName: Full=Small ribosomal subunit protein uS14; AltName: Full=30S ribosomal protein S14 [Rickettsia typhi str. Wilmington]AAU04101.1 30S ribosomal protein S14 [Rickettsia typhi str. Wilmington]AFE54480.1 30S ribosomal protein S14 [Rickettsia typhi str. TH1527]AFE55319.1 30S ribosomal protein S14 [Rickettsia typhi str. B9991CWPP]